MRRFTLSALLVTSAIALACSQQPATSPPSSDATTRAIAAQGPSASQSDDGFRWGPAPAVFPAGAQMAVLQGDPAGTGLFTVRLRFPNGYIIPPHIHPADENVTVISGNFTVGMGTSYYPGATVTLRDGGFITAPANMPHYASAKGPTEVQVHAMGPFAMKYVAGYSASRVSSK
jgi:quercetin dioxygenase-like cupin family protein